jgi:hypothetical protein
MKCSITEDPQAPHPSLCTCNPDSVVDKRFSWQQWLTISSSPWGSPCHHRHLEQAQDLASVGGEQRQPCGEAYVGSGAEEPSVGRRGEEVLGEGIASEGTPELGGTSWQLEG